MPGVLVSDGVAYFAAGRHGRSDEGLVLYALDPFSAKVRWEKRLNNIKSWNDSFIVNDLLVAGGDSLLMSIWRFDPRNGEKNGNWRDVAYLRSGSGSYGGGCSTFPFGLLYDRKTEPTLYFIWPYRDVHGSHGPWSDATYWHYRGISGLMLSYDERTVCGVTSLGKAWSIFAMPADGAEDPKKLPDPL